ncbi:MAG: hypothetical protein ACXADL_17460, partial [Candidatus Thorarchaeota archaeon]
VANGCTFFDNTADKVANGTTSYNEYNIVFGIDLTLTGTAQNALVEALRIGQDSIVSNPTSDFETKNSSKGFVVLDRTNGNKYRIYTDNGVLNTELVP